MLCFDLHTGFAGFIGFIGFTGSDGVNDWFLTDSDLSGVPAPLVGLCHDWQLIVQDPDWPSQT